MTIGTSASTATTKHARYTYGAIAIHWLIAVAIIFQIILGWRMGGASKGPATYAIFQLHKSVGITILLLSLGRLAWRLVNRPPPGPIGQPRWEKVASQLVHAAFYLIMIGLPTTGWIMVSTSRIAIPTILYGLFAWPHLPFLPELAAGPKHLWHDMGETGHGLLVKLTYGLLALHLGAVAKHQLLDKDAVFGHMAPGARPGWLEPRAWLAAFGLIAVIACGYLYSPAIKPSKPLVEPDVAATQIAPTGKPPTKPLQPESATPTAAKLDPEVLKSPVVWRVQPASRIDFSASWAGQPVQGHFKSWTADILFSPDALDRSRLTVSIDMTSASTGDDQRDSSLPGEDFFSAAAHPAATFSAVKFRKTGEGHFVADGILDLRGVKQAVSLPFTLKIEGDTASARGATALDRTLFGVGQGDWASTDQIPAKVTVSFALTAKRGKVSTAGPT